MAKATRGMSSTAFSDLIGTPKSLPLTDHVTKRDILQQALQLRFEDPRDVRNYPKVKVINDTSKLVRDNWALANKQVSEYPVTVSDKEIIRKIMKLWEKKGGVHW